MCPDCRDPRPPYLSPPYIDPAEGTTVPNARLDVVPTFIQDDNEVTPDDIKPDRRFQ